MNSSIVGLFVLVFCFGSSFAQLQLGWNPKSVQVNENQGTVSSTFGKIQGVWPKDLVLICTLKNPGTFPNFLKYKDANTWKSVKNFPSFQLTSSNQNGKIEFKATSDKICRDRKFSLVIACTSKDVPVTVTFPRLDITVINTDGGSICDDPHLTQKVNGLDEDGKQVTKKICYDLFGKGGEQTELMTDSILGTSVVFQLRDDYYIGKAFYSTKLGFFNFTTTEMSWPKTSSKDGSSWGKEQEFVVGEIDSYPHAIVKQSKDDVVVEYKEEKRSQSIRIAKIQQGIGKSYLNILVDKSTTMNDVFDEFHGGLFGFIANQQYEFYDPVQLSSYGNKADVCVVKINGRFVKAFLTGESDRCYSMKLDNILFPKNVESFRKSL